MFKRVIQTLLRKIERKCDNPQFEYGSLGNLHRSHFCISLIINYEMSGECVLRFHASLSFLEPVERAGFKAVRVKALPQAGDFLYFNSGRGRLGLIFPQLGALGAQARKEEHRSHPYFDDGEHPLVGLRVGVDLEALPRVPVDDGVGGPPCTRGGIVLVLNCQVDNNSHGSFLDCGLKL